MTPDNLDNGKENGSCNVTACQMPGATWFNSSTRAYYCPSCARKINRACIDFREERLCTPPEEPVRDIADPCLEISQPGSLK